jgi:arsenate reductase
MITIYHNPRCSKSREALALVEAFGTRKQVPVEVVDYLKSPPTVEQLAALLHTLGCPVSDMVRSNEDEFEALKLENAGDEDMLRAVAAHPRLLQRPIAVFEGRAVIGRPPERVLDLLDPK